MIQFCSLLFRQLHPSVRLCLHSIRLFLLVVPVQGHLYLSGNLAGKLVHSGMWWKERTARHFDASSVLWNRHIHFAHVIPHVFAGITI